MQVRVVLSPCTHTAGKRRGCLRLRDAVDRGRGCLRCCAHPPQPHACGMTWRPYDGRPSDVNAVVQSPPRCVVPRFSISRGARAEDSGMRVAVCGLAGGSAGVTIPSTHKSQRSLLGRERSRRCRVGLAGSATHTGLLPADPTPHTANPHHTLHLPLRCSLRSTQACRSYSTVTGFRRRRRV